MDVDTGCTYSIDGKSLEMKFNSSCSVGEVCEYLDTVDEENPLVETLHLDFDLKMNFNERNGCRVTYQPLYFHNVKELIITAYGEECDFILDYLSISNKKLRELTINGREISETALDSLCNYKKLFKLTIGTSYVDGWELVRLSSLPKLKHLILDVRYLDWDQNNIMEFLENVSTVSSLVLDHDTRDDEFQFTDEFIQKFIGLLLQGRKLKLTYIVAGREIRLSEHGLEEKRPRGCSIQ